MRICGDLIGDISKLIFGWVVILVVVDTKTGLHKDGRTHAYVSFIFCILLRQGPEFIRNWTKAAKGSLFTICNLSLLICFEPEGNCHFNSTERPINDDFRLKIGDSYITKQANGHEIKSLHGKKQNIQMRGTQVC